MTKDEEHSVVVQLNVKLPGNVWIWVTIAVVSLIGNLFGWGIIDIG